MREDLKPAITALQSDLAVKERAVAETKRAINRLCELAGLDLLYDDVDAASRPTVAALRTDHFYGKVLNTAAREYLELRKSSNLGPASPRDIYEALVQGGFKFETKSETNAITALRQVLRKNSSIFHKLPQGVYGLRSWYPKVAKIDDEDAPIRAQRQQKKVGAIRKRRVAKRAGPEGKSEASPVAGLSAKILESLAGGGVWTVAQLKEAIGSVDGRRLQGILLSMRKKKLVQTNGKGLWRKTADKEAA